MSNLNRRQFIQTVGMAGAAAFVAGVPTIANAGRGPAPAALIPTLADVRGKVVVVGGGMAGASVAKYLRLWGGTGLNVTLVERAPSYTSNIMSNGVLTGQRALSTLQYSFATLKSSYGVGVVTASATGIDPAAKTVSLSTGAKLSYDRVVVAPGLAWDAIPGLVVADYDKRFPHAWQAGAQTTLLRNQLVAMKPGQTFIMTIPAAPYRCPPGPYERACLVADWLKKNRPGSKVIILDANPKIMAEPIAFGQAFSSIHAGVIQYVPNAVIDHIDAATKTVYTSAGAFKADVLNPIPPHRAGAIATASGLASVGGRWAGVDVLTYESKVAPGVHVLGDAIGTTMPKSGHVANAQAKVCADAITKLMTGRPIDQAPTTSSACYSPITMTTASWLTGVYHYDAATATMKLANLEEAPAITSHNYEDMSKWFSGLMSDTFK